MRDFVNVVGHNAHKEHLADMLTQVGQLYVQIYLEQTRKRNVICSMPLLNMNSTLNFHAIHQKATKLLRARKCCLKVPFY